MAVQELTNDAAEAGLPLENPEKLTLDILRHSAAHLMASAVVEIFPGAQYDVGPATEEGFFYNFKLPSGATFSEDDLETIGKKMQELVKQKIPYEREIVSRSAAKDLFIDAGQTFKVAIIDRLGPEVEQVSIYRTGDFVDLCRGPHVPDTSWLGVIKLLRVAGVYWRGDERNEQLQRVYGTAFFQPQELQEYLAKLEEAKKRDHRRLGQELDLFSIDDEVGGGLVLWHPNGGLMRTLIEDHWRAAHLAGGYDLVFSPHIAQRSLWETSKHVDFFADDMYGPLFIDERPFQLKPMNCPFHILIYKNRPRSYRELPLRFAELGTVYRYERSGVLHGLLRVRGFTQDDSHIFCRPDQIEDEIGKVVDFCLEMFTVFGFENVRIYLSTKPTKAMGKTEDWEMAEAVLQNQLRLRDIDLQLKPGDGAFYGPKIDMYLLDTLGREWQCATIQFDFTQPENFQLEYVAEDGTKHRPLMVHRALLGAVERFFGLLIEHYAGHFPLWIAPVQCEIISVQDDVQEVNEYADKIKTQMETANLRAVISDKPGERMQSKIRDAELRKVPYVVVVGRRDLERADGIINLRDVRKGTQEDIELNELIERLKQEVASKRPN